MNAAASLRSTLQSNEPILSEQCVSHGHIRSRRLTSKALRRKNRYSRAKSPLNGYVRFRLALTEDRPTIKPYDRTRWAELFDSKTADVELSLRLLEALHAHWTVFLACPPGQCSCGLWRLAKRERTYFHPDHQREVGLE